MFRQYKSHGTGKISKKLFKKIGKNIIFEKGVLVFHPENISLGNNIYIGHNAIIKGYYKNEMMIGDNCWIGQNVYIHSGGGVEIEHTVGIGPGVMILSHSHQEEEPDKPILDCDSVFKKITIETGCDIGIGAIILPGVTIGKYSIVGGGAVVTKDVEPYSVVVGNPAKLLRKRK